jgi:nitroreductase
MNAERPGKPVVARQADHPIEPMFLERWSPRAFDGSVISDEDLLTIFEAARWAPSAFNYQPWRFLYARRGDANWARFLDLLIPFNQAWAGNAAVLVYVLSDTLIDRGKAGDPQPSHSHSFDAGAAWACLALQAARLGHHAHGISGLHFDRAREELAVPERYRIEAAVALGSLATPEGLRSPETPSGRKPLAEIVFAGRLPQP